MYIWVSQWLHLTNLSPISNWMGAPHLLHLISAMAYPVGLPHWGQNLAPGDTDAPHLAQAVCCGAPQDGQNLAPAGIDALHLGHVLSWGAPQDGQNLLPWGTMVPHLMHGVPAAGVATAGGCCGCC